MHLDNVPQAVIPAQAGIQVEKTGFPIKFALEGQNRGS